MPRKIAIVNRQVDAAVNGVGTGKPVSFLDSAARVRRNMKHLVAALVAAAPAVRAKAGTKGQEEEGEENFGRGERVRRVAHEVK